jgi:alpha-glucosidase
VLVAINRGEACEVVLDDSPLLNVKAWQLKEQRRYQEMLSLPAISASVWFGH